MGKLIHRVYLGDSVYVAVEDGMIRLTTENGIGFSNIIYMEPEIVKAFIQYLRKIAPEVMAEWIHHGQF